MKEYINEIQLMEVSPNSKNNLLKKEKINIINSNDKGSGGTEK